jgi:hypothetical protein
LTHAWAAAKRCSEQTRKQDEAHVLFSFFLIEARTTKNATRTNNGKKNQRMKGSKLMFAETSVRSLLVIFRLMRFFLLEAAFGVELLSINLVGTLLAS